MGLKKTIYTLAFATAISFSSCNKNDTISTPQVIKQEKPKYFPLDRTIGYSLENEGFKLYKKFKDGRAITLEYTGCILKTTEIVPNKSNITMKDIDFNDEGLEAIIDNELEKVCYSFEAYFSKTPKCEKKLLEEKNKLFTRYKRDLRFKEHKEYWERTKTQKKSEGFNIYEFLDF